MTPSICQGLTVIFMDTILNSNGKPTKKYEGTPNGECIIGTNFRDLIYGYGGDVRLI